MTLRVALATTPSGEPALRHALEQDGAMVVGPGPADADVLVVDLESLGDAGIRIVQDVMDSAPIPVLALCRGDNSRQAAHVLAAGGVDAITRDAALADNGGLLRRRVRLVSGVGVVRHATWPQSPGPTVGQVSVGQSPGRQTVVAIAGSTGGPAALATVLGELSGLAAAVLVVQHLHAEFMDRFVAWLGGLSALPVAQAHDAESVHGGRVYVAPAGWHLRLGASGTLSLGDQPAALHRPSADELLDSVAIAAGPAGVGVVLTGMGRDGAIGLLAMRRAGGRTFVQDEASSAVFGMPQAALDVGAVDHTTALTALGPAIRAAAEGAS